MRSVGSTAPRLFIFLLPLVIAPIAALAAQVLSSMEVSVQVVPAYSSAATAALNAEIERIGTAGTRATTSAVAGNDAECKAIGNAAIVNGIWATCSWEPVSRVYLVTLQY